MGALDASVLRAVTFARWLALAPIMAAGGGACTPPDARAPDGPATLLPLLPMLAEAERCPPGPPAAEDPMGYRAPKLLPGEERISRDGGQILLDRFAWFSQLTTAPLRTAEPLSDAEIQSWRGYLMRCRSSFGIAEEDALEPHRVDDRTARFEQRVAGLGSPLAAITLAKPRHNPAQSVIYVGGHFWPIGKLGAALDGAARGIAFAWPRAGLSSFTIRVAERRGDALLDATTKKPIATGLLATQCAGNGFTCDVWLDARPTSADIPVPLQGYPWVRRLPSKDELASMARAWAAASPLPIQTVVVEPEGYNRAVGVELASRTDLALTEEDVARAAELIRRTPSWFGLASADALGQATRPDPRSAVFEQRLANVPIPLGQIRVGLTGSTVFIQGHFWPMASAPPLTLTVDRARALTRGQQYVSVVHEEGHPCDPVRSRGDCAGAGPRTRVTRWSAAQMTFAHAVQTLYTADRVILRIVTVSRPPDQPATSLDDGAPAPHLPNDWDAVTGDALADTPTTVFPQPFSLPP